MQRESPIQFALAYATLGLGVIPVHSCLNGVCSCRNGRSCNSPGKHPRSRNGSKDATVDAKQLQAKWRRHPESNVGIATGASSGLLVIDIDPKNGGDASFDGLVTELGHVPATPTSRTGSGGRHLLFKHPGGRVKSSTAIRPGIDIRADGAFIVAPPSIHMNGLRYVWMDGLSLEELQPSGLPIAWLDYLGVKGCYRESERQRVRDAKESEATPGRATGPPEYGGMETPAVQRAIAKTLPVRPGNRNRAIFDFARALKGLPELADHNPCKLLPLVEMWHQQATMVSGDHTLEDTIEEFLYGWDRVRVPGGFDLLELARKVAAAPTHPAATRLCFTSPSRRIIVGLCAELQLVHGEAPFFLSSHKAAAVISEILERQVFPMECHRTLQAMVTAKLLTEILKGNQREATRFKFTWTP